MTGKVITITPTGEKSEDGYKMAIARLYNAPKREKSMALRLMMNT